MPLLSQEGKRSTYETPQDARNLLQTAYEKVSKVSASASRILSVNVAIQETAAGNVYVLVYDESDPAKIVANLAAKFTIGPIAPGGTGVWEPENDQIAILEWCAELNRHREIIKRGFPCDVGIILAQSTTPGRWTDPAASNVHATVRVQR